MLEHCASKRARSMYRATIINSLKIHPSKSWLWSSREMQGLTRMVRYFNGARRICLSVRGQALIETALVVPFLMMIFVGAAELARIEYASIEIANAAIAAAIYGAQTGGTYKDNAGM